MKTTNFIIFSKKDIKIWEELEAPKEINLEKQTVSDRIKKLDEIIETINQLKGLK